jgi:hypothetical protein
MTKIITLNIFETKLILSLLTLLILIVAFVFNKMLGGIVFKYYKIVRIKKDTSILMIIHTVASLLIGVIVPNNFLIDFIYFQELYSKNEMWIPVSMISVFFISLFIIGILLNYICRILYDERDTKIY